MLMNPCILLSPQSNIYNPSGNLGRSFNLLYPHVNTCNVYGKDNIWCNSHTLQSNLINYGRICSKSYKLFKLL